jgi:hypothetical protein
LLPPKIAAAWISVIWVMVTLMLWLARRRDQSGNSPNSLEFKVK